MIKVIYRTFWRDLLLIVVKLNGLCGNTNRSTVRRKRFCNHRTCTYHGMRSNLQLVDDLRPRSYIYSIMDYDLA